MGKNDDDPKRGEGAELTDRITVPSLVDPSTAVDVGIGEGVFRENTERMAAPSFEATAPVQRAGVPQKIGRYVVIDLLGRGGMAEVFLCKQDGPAGFEKQVVIKRSLPHLVDNPRYVEMFLREARIAARLNHPNVVQIYELGQDSESYFIAMEHVDGLTLHRLARRAWRVGRSMPMEVALRAIADAAIGLHHAHELPDADGNVVTLVHRDISPDNLIVNRDGATKVLDFGIAKASDTNTVTRSGEIKGKIPFMSPEQVRGEPLDKRTDLYALGVCLYWLVTGERPFDGGSDFLTMSAVCERQPERPSAKNPRVPPAVDRIVLRLLQKDPAQRYQTGEALHDDIVELIAQGRSGSASFVREMMALPDAAEGDVPPSEGFLPATPISSRLLAHGEITGPAPTPPPPAPRRNTLVIAAAAAAVLVVGLLVALLARGAADDEVELAVVGPVPVEASPPAIAPPPGAPSAPTEPSAPSEPSEPSEPSAPSEPSEPSEPAWTVDEGPAPSEPAALETSGAAPRGQPSEASAPAEEKGRAAPVEKKRRAPGTLDVVVKAPPHVEWRLGRKVLARGSGTLSLPAQTRSVIAVDRRLEAETEVALTGGPLSYLALPTGTLELRVVPYAEVFLGKQSLGTTPIPPRTLIAGKYTITLRYKDQQETRTVEIGANKRAVVKKVW